MTTKTIFALAFVTFLSCANIQNNLTSKSGKVIDKKLVGIFNGKISNASFESSTTWIINRKVDGTYILDKQFRLKGRSTRIQTIGNWWTEGGKYYQKNTNTDQTSIYTYNIANSKAIVFKSTSTEEDYGYSEEKE